MTHLQRIFVKLGLEVFNFLNLFRKFDSNTKPERETTARTDLTVGLLVSGASSGTSELLGLALPGIGDEQGSVVLDQDVLDGLLAVLINVFLVKGDKGLGEGLANGVDLGDAATTLDADPTQEMRNTLD